MLKDKLSKGEIAKRGQTTCYQTKKGVLGGQM